MNLLIDTNIFLEILLQQSNAAEAKRLLSAAGRHAFYMSDFSLHSIGVLLLRHKQYQTLKDFVEDLITPGSVSVLGLLPAELEIVADTARQFHLDFDDAYQYTLGEKFDLTIVSFDSDFDRTPRGRRTPIQV